MDERPEPPRELAPELIAQYRQSTYRFELGGETVRMRVDDASAGLAEAHRRHGVASSAFLTAWNPRSEPRDERENDARNEALRSDLRRIGLGWLEAKGVAADESWEEPSLLVLGIGEEAARALARRYGQNAFLFAGKDAVPRLVLTADN